MIPLLFCKKKRSSFSKRWSMPKILAIDDDPSMLDWLIPTLQMQGYEVEGYLDAYAALERFRTEKFDLVLTDLYMPELDGKTFTLQVKELCPQLPVIIITAYPSAESILDLQSTGISDYITKPFDISKLLDSVVTALNLS
jgi:DNA-binding NtrC family response regulator